MYLFDVLTPCIVSGDNTVFVCLFVCYQQYCNNNTNTYRGVSNELVVNNVLFKISSFG